MFSMNLIYKYVGFYRDICFGYLLKILSLYYQTYAMNFHLWVTLLVFYFVKTQIAFNNPFLPFITLFSLSLMPQ